MTFSSRFSRRALPVLGALFVLILSTEVLVAQSAGAAGSQRESARLANAVQKKLASLQNYSVFDWIYFRLYGNTVILQGYAGLPTLKTNAGKAVKGVPGVASVDNQIEVLPLSMVDDRIRRAVYDRIYTQPNLRKYNAYQGTVRWATRPQPNLTQMAGGILYDPPTGYNAIHIIVKNGNVSLFGVVDNQTDANLAAMQAKSTPGVFSVENHLIVAQGVSERKK